MAICGDQFFAESGERVAITRSRGIRRNRKLSRDLIEGELAPNLEHENFPLLAGQAAQRPFDGLPAVVVLGGRFEKWAVVFGQAFHPTFPLETPGIAT